jgi:hypothetical protein
MLNLSQEVVALVTTQSDESRTGIIQAGAIIVSEKRSQCSGLRIAVSPHHHKGRLDEAFSLEPGLAATRTIGCLYVFRDHAFKVTVETCLKEGSTISYELLAELNTALGIGTNKTIQ